MCLEFVWKCADFCAATPLKRTLSRGLGRGGRFLSCKHVVDLDSLTQDIDFAALLTKTG